jgi:glutaredoxin-like YruB-family protein
MSQVTVYTTPTCPYCRYVKQFLNSKGVPYIEKNVAADRTAAVEMIRKSGQQGVPVTVINDQVIVGFDQPALNEAVVKLRSQPGGANPSANPSGFKLGAKAANAAKVLAGKGQTALEGALLGPVAPGSAAEKAGLREGDVVVAIGSHYIRNVDDLQKALASLSGLPIAAMAGSVGLAYVRDGQRLQTKLPLK